jgi:hypothetical protein
MTRKLMYALVVIAIVGVGAILVWKYVNKPSKDFVNEKIDFSYSCKDLLEKTSSDTAAASQLLNHLVGVDGEVINIIKEPNALTIELGSSSSNASVICQIDNRHLDDFKQTKVGDELSIKGKITACSADDELGIGSSIQMNFCSINK